jgi:hypothetical protein
MFAEIAAAVSIGSSLLGLAGSSKSNSRAREAAKLQSNLTYEQRQEEIRRAILDQNQLLGRNRAAIGASNITFGGSSQQVLQGMQAEFAKDIAWRQRSADLEKTAIRKGGPGAGANWASAASAIGSIGNTLMNYNR